MNFRVETAALRTAKTRLKELGSDTSVATSYAIEHLDVSGADNGVLFVHVDNVCTDTRLKVLDVLSRLDSLLHDSGNELGLVARHYDQSDHNSLARMDAQIPPEPKIPKDERYVDDPVVDTAPEDPGDYVPEEHEDDEDGVIMAPGPFDPYTGGYGTGSGTGVQA
ncbi:hypothetical protein [Nocardioides daejeonensis]|uniref:hypothetical protein n=1 Tax=Nocardioides daejeonensis TaxID=1046556 RepID=UPI000D749544|nr:hypothetical protein [Nocardioides daejeonensis]